MTAVAWLSDWIAFFVSLPSSACVHVRCFTLFFPKSISVWQNKQKWHICLKDVVLSQPERWLLGILCPVDQRNLQIKELLSRKSTYNNLYRCVNLDAICLALSTSPDVFKSPKISKIWAGIGVERNVSFNSIKMEILEINVIFLNYRATAPGLIILCCQQVITTCFFPHPVM